MLVFLSCLSFLAGLASPAPVPPPDFDPGLGLGPRGGTLLGEPPGKSEYELKLSPDRERLEVYPLDRSKAPSKEQLNGMSVLLFKSPTEGAVDRVSMQPAVPDPTPNEPLYSARLSPQQSNFFGVELRMSFKDGTNRTYTNGGDAVAGMPLRALSP